MGITREGKLCSFCATPGGHRRNAPRLGQDTDQVLREVGLNAEQIAELKRRGIVAGG